MKIRGMLLLLVCILGGTLRVQAAPWGAFALDPQQTHTQKDRPYYILSQLSDGKPLHVSMEFAEPEQAEMYRDLYQKEIAKSYQRWFKNAVHFIKQNKRNREFVRMLARLNKPGKIIFVANGQEADLLVKVMSWDSVQENCHGHENLEQGTMACVLFEKGKLPVLYAPTLADLKDFMILKDSRAANIKDVEQRMFFGFILPHEIGHTLGLDDQYDGGRKSHRMYRSTHIRKGMMRDLKGFTCDDADGLINLIDIIRGTEINRKQGWHSLCVDSPDVYVDGIAKGTGPYMIYSDDRLTWTVETYQRNQKIREQTFTFDTNVLVNPLQDIPDREIWVRDELDRPVRTAGPKGEIIYYSYDYETRFRLITYQNKVVRVEYFKEKEMAESAFSPLNKIQIYAQIFVTSSGEPVEMIAATQAFTGKILSYREGPLEEPLLEIELEYDRNGRLVNQKIPQQTEVHNAAKVPAKNRTSGSWEQHAQQQITAQTQAKQLEQRVELLKKWGAKK